MPHDLLGHRHFQVEFDVHGLLEEIQIAVLDVPAVFAEVDRDAVGSAQFGLDGGPDGVRFVGPPGLPDGGHVIDIDSEQRHRWFSVKTWGEFAEILSPQIAYNDR